MVIQIWIKEIHSGKKLLIQEVLNNYFVEAYLSSEKGVLEAGTSKTLKINDVYSIAGYASIYLFNYKEPEAKSSTGITSSITTQKIDKMREMKLQAKNCLMFANTMLKYINPNRQVAIKVKR